MKNILVSVHASEWRRPTRLFPTDILSFPPPSPHVHSTLPYADIWPCRLIYFGVCWVWGIGLHHICGSCRVQDCWEKQRNANARKTTTSVLSNYVCQTHNAFVSQQLLLGNCMRTQTSTMFITAQTSLVHQWHPGDLLCPHCFPPNDVFLP